MKLQVVGDNLVNYEYGVDLHSDLRFENGDLVLCSYDNNLAQAVCNRLNTDLDELDIFYDDYGSVLNSFLGWKKTADTLSLIRLELMKCLSNEPRLNNFDIDLEYGEKGELKIRLTVYDNSVQSYNFILNNDYVEYVENEEGD